MRIALVTPSPLKIALVNIASDFCRFILCVSHPNRGMRKKIAYAMLAAIQGNEKMTPEFEKFLMDTNVKVPREPLYGTEEWAERQAESYKQELLAESREKMFEASQNIKGAQKGKKIKAA